MVGAGPAQRAVPLVRGHEGGPEKDHPAALRLPGPPPHPLPGRHPRRPPQVREYEVESERESDGGDGDEVGRGLLQEGTGRNMNCHYNSLSVCLCVCLHLKKLLDCLYWRLLVKERIPRIAKLTNLFN